MYAAQISINEWHRGIVVNIFKEGDITMYIFLSIDYGFTEIITAGRYL